MSKVNHLKFLKDVYKEVEQDLKKAHYDILDFARILNKKVIDEREMINTDYKSKGHLEFGIEHFDGCFFMYVARGFSEKQSYGTYYRGYKVRLNQDYGMDKKVHLLYKCEMIFKYVPDDRNNKDEDDNNEREVFFDSRDWQVIDEEDIDEEDWNRKLED